MYKVYKGIDEHEDYENRQAAVKAAKALSKRYSGRVQVLREDRGERLRYRNGSLQESIVLTSSDRRRGSRLEVGGQA